MTVDIMQDMGVFDDFVEGTQEVEEVEEEEVETETVEET